MTSEILMTQHFPDPSWTLFTAALREAGFAGQIEDDPALRAAMSSDNSVYQIQPDLVVAPIDVTDMVKLAAVLDRPQFRTIKVTARGGGTGTNGQSLNRGLIVDTRRHMNRLLALDPEAGWADVEPGMVLDALNEAIRPSGWFFAPETSTSTRCTIGGMVSTDASGKGSRIYGKTSDNILGLEIAQPAGVLSSTDPTPSWAIGMLQAAEAAARGGRDAFMANTPRLNRRFTGYDLERACPETGGFEWWRLFLGAEGTLGLISRIRVKLRRIEAEKRLLVVGFDTFRNALAAATPLLAADPTAIEVMDERVQALAGEAGILSRLPPALQGQQDQRIAYVFVEFNGDDADALAGRLARARDILRDLPGAGALHEARDLAEIRELWAIRSAGVGLLGKVDGRARPVAFVEDCVVPPENLPAFVDDFLAVLTDHGLGFGIYGHVDVGCLHIRPALDIDADADRARLVSVSDKVQALTRKHGGIFWGEHGKGVRGAYLRDWIGPEAYAALQGVKAAFDPDGRFNPGKLVSPRDDIMGIATTPFRPFNAPDGDPLKMAFRCNGNAQCLSYAEKTPMCPSFKATADLRHSPKGRADGLRAWALSRDPALEAALLVTMDSCLGCKACASTCPVQVDIPTMRSAFLADHYSRNRRPLADRLTLAAERFSRLTLRLAPVLRPLWPMTVKLAERLTATRDMPARLARAPRMVQPGKLQTLPANAVILVQDWFTALFDEDLQRDVVAGLKALGFEPHLLAMRPAGKVAQTLGDMAGFRAMADRLADDLHKAAGHGLPLVGMDPAFVMQLRQDWPKAGITAPKVLSLQEFLVSRLDSLPRARKADPVTLFSHCTESTATPAAADWGRVMAAIGIPVQTPATGCCGMAGLYGHQERHQASSRKLFDMSWAPQLKDRPEVAATGFSCRCQVERLSDSRARHPLGLIASAFSA